MVLTRLTYFSRIRLHGPINDHLDEILVTSVANNRRDDITGVLVRDGTWFAQMLEGRESIVSATFERILCDWRHSDVSLVSMQRVSERRFADCWMTDIAYGKENADLFRHYGESDHFDPRLMRVDRLCDLIEELADRAMSTLWTPNRATNAVLRTLTIHKEMLDVQPTKEEFKKRYWQRFYDPAFGALTVKLMRRGELKQPDAGLRPPRQK